MSKKLTLKGASRNFLKDKTISRKQAANAALQKIDNSRLFLLITSEGVLGTTTVTVM